MSNPPKKLNVLVVAEAANPDWTSVPLIGWSHTEALAQRCNVHLVTQIRNKPFIEKRGWVDGKDFTAIDSEALDRPFYSLASKLRGDSQKGWTIDTAIGSLTYPYFEYLIWKHFGADLKAGEYDVVHRITPVSPTSPSLLAKRLHQIGVPFVVGPLNGGVPWPEGFRQTQHKEREWLHYFRNLYRYVPGYRATRRYASALLMGSESTFHQLPEQYQSKALYMPENAIDTKRFNKINQSEFDLPLKAAFVGRLVPYKGCDMLIESIAPLAKKGLIELDIFGDGPERPSLEAMIKHHNLSNAIRMHGNVNHEILQDSLVQADLLTFPSIREFGGGVVLEAMALGVVPVVADYAGPRELVCDRSGYRVAMGSRSQLIANFRSQLEAILKEPSQLIKKRQGAIERVEKWYTWEAKAQQVEQVYRWVLGHGERPNWGMPFDAD